MIGSEREKAHTTRWSSPSSSLLVLSCLNVVIQLDRDEKNEEEEEEEDPEAKERPLNPDAAAARLRLLAGHSFACRPCSFFVP